MATPLFIAIGLHYQTRAGEFEPERINAPAVQDALAAFVEHGLLIKLDQPDSYGANYAPTDGLKVWCDALCSVDWPTREWVMPSPDQERQ